MIEFNKIRQEKVKKLLRDNHITTRNDLSQLRSFCFDAADGQHYHKHIKSFLIKADVNTVWHAYKTIGPQETWRGTMVSFGMMYSRKRNEILYPDDQYTGIEEGQIIFLNLNLFANLLHLAVGHEVTGVDDQAKTIKICYLQNGASTGTQLIQLHEKGSHTEVIHETWYRSGSLFRDKVLYPGFHEKGLTEFHENVKRNVELNVELRA